MKAKKIKTSRRSFIWNYVIGIGLFLYLFLSDVMLVISPIVTLILIFLILLLFIEPEALILYRTFFINPESVLEVKGVLTKRKIAIPYRNINSEKLIKGIIGRILNFGNITIISSNSVITMIGVKNPDKIYNIIEKKLKVYRKPEKE